VGGGQSPATSTEGVPQAAVIATAAQRALANPAASRALATGFQRASNSLSGNDNGPSATTTSNPSNADHAAPAVNVGRVAAAAQAFSAAASPTPLLPRQAKPPVPAPAHKRTDSSGLVPQKVSVTIPLLGSRAFYPLLLPIYYTFLLFYTLSICLLGCAQVWDVARFRNLEMLTYPPLVRCTALCVGRLPQRMHRPRRCTHHLHSQRRKAASHRPPCAVSLRQRPLYKWSQSQSRNSNRKGERKRKRLGSGQKRCMIIPVRCVFHPFSRLLKNERRLPRRT
jgi:hypothetical protein